MSFKSRDVVDVQEAVFDYDAVVTTYACRAGISVNGKDLTGMDAGQENSPGTKDGGLLGRECQSV